METDKFEDESLSSDSSSDSNEEIDEEELNQQISSMKKQIQNNYLDYDAHVNLISLLRKRGDLEELRNARRKMNEVYPLSPDLWLEWVSDEQKICITDNERKNIVELFEKAVVEYTSVKIWVEYIMFMLGGGDNVETQRICERALTAVGIHVSEGALVWQAALLVEQQIFANLKEKGDEAKVEEQKKKIQNLYRRHARVPLLKVEEEELFKEASVWFDGQIDNQMKKNFDSSSKKLEGKLPFEISIIEAQDETSKLEVYRKYLDHVLKNDNPSVIQNTYERTLTDLCLNASIWEEYVRFAIKQFPFADYAVLPVCERSQRNCPWSADLCSLHISALQKFSENYSKEDLMTKIKACLKITLGSGLQDGNELTKAWMSYLVFLRRNVPFEEDNSPILIQFREACEQAMQHIDQHCSELGDPECEIARYQARIEAQFVHNMEGARGLWNDWVMQRNDNFKSAALWFEFINLERCFGDEKHSRKLFRRALERSWESVEVIGKAFLKFEQEVGTFETMEDFEKRYRDRLSIVMRKRMEDAAREDAEKSKKDKQPNKKGKEKWSSPKKSDPSIGSTSKFPSHIIFNDSGEFKKPFIPKQEEKIPMGYKRKLSHDSPQEEILKKTKVEASHGEFVQHDSSKDFRSVFLSNLDFSSKKEDILPTFKDCGPIEELRLARDFKGRSKGFGYLIFEGPSSLPKALALDRSPIGTRPIFVSPCDPSRRGAPFKYSSGVEKDKLFVKGLPHSLGEREIKAVFDKHAPVKNLRLVTHRNGYSKGICFIQFEDEKTADAVRQATDGTTLEGFQISVMISNPSASKTPKPEAAGRFNPTSLGATGRSTARPKLAFMPRALQRRSNEQDKEISSSANGSTKTDLNGATSGETSSSKSNEDFRKMFLN